jgi:hypothetical protein
VPLLVCQQEETLNVVWRQEIKLPVFVIKERAICRSQKLEAECQVGEAPKGESGIGQPLPGPPFQDAEVPKGCEEAPDHPDGNIGRPGATLAVQPIQGLAGPEAAAEKGSLRKNDLSAEIADHRLRYCSDPVVDRSHNLNRGLHIFEWANKLPCLRNRPFDEAW